MRGRSRLDPHSAGGSAAAAASNTWSGPDGAGNAASARAAALEYNRVNIAGARRPMWKRHIAGIATEGRRAPSSRPESKQGQKPGHFLSLSLSLSPLKGVSRQTASGALCDENVSTGRRVSRCPRVERMAGSRARRKRGLANSGRPGRPALRRRSRARACRQCSARE